MRGLAAHVGDEPGKHTLLELQHVGRRQVVRHQHQRHIQSVIQQQILLALVSNRRRHDRRCRTQHAPQHALDHLLQIGLALTQVLVLHLVELARNDLELGGQRPLGVVETIADPVLHTTGQRLVLQQHQVHIEQGRQLVRRILGHFLLQALQLVDHGIAPGTHPVDLALHLVGRNEVMRHVQPAGRHDHRAPDGHPTGNWYAVDAEGHFPNGTGPPHARSPPEGLRAAAPDMPAHIRTARRAVASG